MGESVSQLREEETSNTSMLEHLPDGPLFEIVQYLNQMDLSTVRESSLGLAGLFKKSLEELKPITFVIQGKEYEVLALLKKSSESLLIKKKSVDYSGRSFYNTPIQAAFFSHDIILFKKMIELFDKLPNGQAILA